MKRISHLRTARDKLLHIETEYAIVNIRVGLRTTDGKDVTSIEILADHDAWFMDAPDSKAMNIRLAPREGGE